MIVEKGAFRLTEKLRQWLELKGWTQRELATELKVDESLISMWLDKDNPRHPSWQQLKKVCLLTGLDISELMTFDRNIERDDKE
ncbi:MAG TPA: helix-turn-helix transcriptional regulator [Candidatus Obscuribacterales bacterium]